MTFRNGLTTGAGAALGVWAISVVIGLALFIVGMLIFAIFGIAGTAFF